MMQWYVDYLDALRDGITSILRDQFDTRVNRFLSHKTTLLLGPKAIEIDCSELEEERGAFER